MIALIGASAIYLTALQAAINGPRDTFRTCLKETSVKASGEKVAADGVEAYIKTGCSVQLDRLRSALISFGMKNGMSRKQAIDDAAMTIGDYLGSSVDHYKFMADVNSPAPKVTNVAPKPTQASAPQPPKP